MHIGIVGAGIAGLLTAHQATLQNYQVTLFDNARHGNKTNCSHVGAGLLAPFAELEKAELAIFELGQQSLQLWPTILASLSQPVFYQQQGSIMVAHHQDRHELTRLQHILLQQPIECLNQSAITELEPELSHFEEALFFPSEGQLAPQQLLLALESFLKNHHVKLNLNTTIKHVKPKLLIDDNNTSYSFDWVIDCRGLGAQRDLNDLRGVRGELIWLHAPNVKLTRPIRLFHPRYHLYVAPRPDDIYILGASNIESNDLSTISVKSSLELLSSAYSLHRGFAEARILKTLSQTRPAFPNNLPRVIHEDGLTRINGLYRHGYLIAPALIEQVFLNIQQNN